MHAALGNFAALSLFALSFGRAEPAAAEHFALLVAAPKCADERWPELRFAEQDIARLAELLGRCGYLRENIVRLSPAASRGDTTSGGDEKSAPTRENLLASCRAIGRRAKSEDTLSIVLSCHGVEGLADGREQTLFCLADGAPSDSRSLVALSEIIAGVDGDAGEEKTRAAHVVLLVDACRTRLRIGDRKGERDGEREPPKLEISARWRVLFSCAAGQSAYEDPRVQHGVFPHFVIEGLRGSADASDDGRVSVSELAKFVSGRVGKHVRERLGKEQTPQFVGEVNGADDAVMATYRP